MSNQSPSCMHCGHVFAPGEPGILVTHQIILNETSQVRLEIIAPYCNDTCAAQDEDLMTELAVSLLAAETLRGTGVYINGD